MKSQQSEHIPKNINEYKHLLANSQLVGGDLDWILDLRSPPSKYKFKTGNTQPNPPSFYDDDLKKVKRRFKSIHIDKSEPFLRTDNTFKLNHLVKNNVNPIDLSILNYESSLRVNKFPKGYKSAKHSKKWEDIAYAPTEKDEDKFLPPLLEKSKENLAKINKYVLRDYVPVYDKVEVEGQQIKRKKFIKNKNATLDYLGDHLSMRPYEEKYKTKNINCYTHILNSHTNSLSRFETGLRYLENDGIVIPKKKKKKVVKKSDKVKT